MRDRRPITFDLSRDAQRRFSPSNCSAIPANVHGRPIGLLLNRICETLYVKSVVAQDSARMVRWHMLPDTVQRAVKRARRETGIMAVPHELRHSYATHSLNRGVNIKALSEAMGHKQIETTSKYCHAEALSVPSPLDNML